MKTILEQRAEQLGLLVIDTTDNGNGYPSNLKKGVIGFDSFKQAEEFAKEVNGEVTHFYKRYGWKVYTRRGRAWEEYEEGMECHEDSSVYVIGVMV